MPKTYEYLDHKEFFGEEDPDIAFSRLWFYILRCQRRYLPRIAAALKDEGLRDPIWYEVLFELKQAGEPGQSMTMLQDRLTIPQYALSRHVSRMEAAGMILRSCDGADRRKQMLRLSAYGHEMQEKAWQLYFDTILTELKPLLDSDKAYDMARDLLRLTP